MKRAAILAILASTLLLLTAYALAFLPDTASFASPVLLALGTAGVLASTLMLAAQRNGRLGVLWIPVVFIVLVVGGGLVGLLMIPEAEGADARLFLGLPLRAAILMYGIGLFPTLVVPVAYALTFERLTLSPSDLERVREAGRRWRERPDAEEEDA